MIYEIDELEEQLARVIKVFQEIRDMCQEYLATEVDPFVLQAVTNKADYGMSRIQELEYQIKLRRALVIQAPFERIDQA